jgi:hypothetical protein
MFCHKISIWRGSVFTRRHGVIFHASSTQFDPKNFRRHFVAWSQPLLVGEANLSGRPWNPNQVITEDALSALAMVGYFLSARVVEPKIAESSLPPILSRLEALIEQVTAADDLDPDLRAFLVRHLTNLAERLRLIRIYGRPGVDEAVGRFMIEAAQIEKSAEMEQRDAEGDRRSASGPRSRLLRFVQSESYQACRTLIDDLLKVVGAATGLLAIAQGFGLFALPPSDQAPGAPEQKAIESGEA